MKVPSEAVEAKALVRWVRDECPELRIAHIPNETPTTPDIAAKMKQQGVSSGVPDYLVAHRYTHKHIFIELKRLKGGVESPAQKKWRKTLGKCCRVCHGHKAAIRFIQDKLL